MSVGGSWLNIVASSSGHNLVPAPRWYRSPVKPDNHLWRFLLYHNPSNPGREMQLNLFHQRSKSRDEVKLSSLADFNSCAALKKTSLHLFHQSTSPRLQPTHSSGYGRYPKDRDGHRLADKSHHRNSSGRYFSPLDSLPRWRICCEMPLQTICFSSKEVSWTVPGLVHKALEGEVDHERPNTPRAH